jgi:hypothetical protein
MSNPPFKLSNPAIDLSIAAGLAVMAALWFTLTSHHGIELRDEGHILRLSALTADGALVHRDFSDVYGPGVYGFGAWALSAADGGIAGVRSALIGVKALLVMIVFGIALRIAGRGWAIFAGFLAIAFWGRSVWNLNTPYASLLTLPLLCAGLYFVVLGIPRRSRACFALTGALVGIAFFFKHSLAIYGGIGLGLAIWAGAMFSKAPREPSPQTARDDRSLLIAWLAAGAVALLPVAHLIAPADYLLHFLVLHAFVGAVALAIFLRGAAVGPAELLRHWLAPYVAAGLGVVALGAIPYLVSGSLARTYDDMFRLPLELVNYYEPVRIAGLFEFALLAGVGLAVWSALAGIGARRGRAIGLLSAALVAFAGSWFFMPEELRVIIGNDAGALRGPQLSWDQGLWRLPNLLISAQHSILLFLALVVFGPKLWVEDEAGARARRAIPVLLFGAFLCFALFPRVSLNEWILMGPQAFLIAIVCWGVHRSVAARASRRGSVAAALVVAAIPIWLAIDPVLITSRRLDSQQAHTPVEFERGRGLVIARDALARARFEEFDVLIEWFERVTPGDAPVLLLTNQEMVLFATGRPPAFPEHETSFFLAGWNMLPESRIAEIDVDELLERLDSGAVVFVVDRDDHQAESFRHAFPDLVAGVQERSRAVARIGRYVVSRIGG